MSFVWGGPTFSVKLGLGPGFLRGSKYSVTLGRGGPRNMKSIWPPLAAIFLWLIYTGLGGAMAPLASPQICYWTLAQVSSWWPDVDLLCQEPLVKECQSIVRGESVYLTMLSGHSRDTHSVSVPNISVLLHTHVEAVLKFEVVSHFAHFWSYCSTTLAKNMTKIANDGIFCLFSPPYRHQNITKTSPCCRGCSQLRFGGSYVKIGWEMASEMSKMWDNFKF